MKSYLLSLLACTLFLGCRGSTLSRTEVLVVVDSDLAVPDELDQIRFRATGPNGTTKEATASLDVADGKLPRSLALVHEGGALSPLAVEVQGKKDGTVVLVRQARLAFVKGRTLVLPMHLLKSCVDVMCGEGTCTEHGCGPVGIDPSSLDSWNGAKPRLSGSEPNEDGQDGSVAAGDSGQSTEAMDAAAGESSANDAAVTDAAIDDAGAKDSGTNDAGMCVPKTEVCNQLDDDCDEVIDNGFDLQNDPKHCGASCAVCGVNKLCCAGVCKKVCN